MRSRRQTIILTLVLLWQLSFIATVDAFVAFAPRGSRRSLSNLQPTGRALARHNHHHHLQQHQRGRLTSTQLPSSRESNNVERPDLSPSLQNGMKRPRRKNRMSMASPSGSAAADIVVEAPSVESSSPILIPPPPSSDVASSSSFALSSSSPSSTATTSSNQEERLLEEKASMLFPDDVFNHLPIDDDKAVEDDTVESPSVHQQELHVALPSPIIVPPRPLSSDASAAALATTVEPDSSVSPNSLEDAVTSEKKKNKRKQKKKMSTPIPDGVFGQGAKQKEQEEETSEVSWQAGPPHHTGHDDADLSASVETSLESTHAMPSSSSSSPSSSLPSHETASIPSRAEASRSRSFDTDESVNAALLKAVEYLQKERLQHQRKEEETKAPMPKQKLPIRTSSSVGGGGRHSTSRGAIDIASGVTGVKDGLACEDATDNEAARNRLEPPKLEDPSEGPPQVAHVSSSFSASSAANPTSSLSKIDADADVGSISLGQALRESIKTQPGVGTDEVIASGITAAALLFLANLGHGAAAWQLALLGGCASSYLTRIAGPVGLAFRTMGMVSMEAIALCQQRLPVWQDEGGMSFNLADSNALQEVAQSFQDVQQRVALILNFGEEEPHEPPKPLPAQGETTSMPPPKSLTDADGRVLSVSQDVHAAASQVVQSDSDAGPLSTDIRQPKIVDTTDGIVVGVAAATSLVAFMVNGDFFLSCLVGLSCSYAALTPGLIGATMRTMGVVAVESSSFVSELTARLSAKVETRLQEYQLEKKVKAKTGIDGSTYDVAAIGVLDGWRNDSRTLPPEEVKPPAAAPPLTAHEFVEDISALIKGSFIRLQELFASTSLKVQEVAMKFQEVVDERTSKFDQERDIVTSEKGVTSLSDSPLFFAVEASNTDTGFEMKESPVGGPVKEVASQPVLSDKDAFGAHEVTSEFSRLAAGNTLRWDDQKSSAYTQDTNTDDGADPTAINDEGQITRPKDNDELLRRSLLAYRLELSSKVLNVRGVLKEEFPITSMPTISSLSVPESSASQKKRGEKLHRSLLAYRLKLLANEESSGTSEEESKNLEDQSLVRAHTRSTPVTKKQEPSSGSTPKLDVTRDKQNEIIHRSLLAYRLSLLANQRRSVQLERADQRTDSTHSAQALTTEAPARKGYDAKDQRDEHTRRAMLASRLESEALQRKDQCENTETVFAVPISQVFPKEPIASTAS